MIRLLFTHDIFFIINIGIGLLFGLSLLLKGIKMKHPMFYLGVFLFVFSWYFLIYILTTTGLIVHCPLLLKLLSPFYYAGPPALYMYIRYAFTSKVDSLSWKISYVHFLPVILGFIDNVPYYFLTQQERLNIAIHIAENINNIFYFKGGYLGTKYHYYFRAIQELIYFVIILRLIWKYKLRSLEISRLFIVCVLLMLISRAIILVIGLIQSKYVGGDARIINYTVIPYMIVVCGIYISWFSAKLYFSNLSCDLISKKDDSLIENNSKEVRIHLSNEEIEAISCSILSYFKERGFEFIDGEISIQNLADAIRFPKYKVSHYFNGVLGLTFKEWVNGKRVEKFLEKIQNGDLEKKTINSIAEDCGFKSKTSFYCAFKRHTGYNPSEYLKIKDL